MRSDMPKLLVERPRGGPRIRHRRKHMRAVRDFDELPKRVSIARDNPKTKWLSENLAPLARLLERRVGCVWDQVYAEIRAHVRFDDPIQLHVLEHLWDYVERHVVMIEGYPCDQRRRQPLRCYGRRFYVCPQTGILRRVPGLRMPGYLPRPRHRRRNGSRR